MNSYSTNNTRSVKGIMLLLVTVLYFLIRIIQSGVSGQTNQHETTALYFKGGIENIFFKYK